ncbi:MAG: LOG family protein [Chlamydiales bacterium]|nr:LOG family protein [Chlamydiales bacterium]
MDSKHIKEPVAIDQVKHLITSCGGDPDSISGGLVTEMIQTSLKLLFEGHDLGQVKLINRCLKEMRYAYRIFNEYPHAKRISVFGSSRTPETHPDYQQAKELAATLVARKWMCITGAAEGIMKAGHEGSQAEGAFGLSIYLPQELTTNQVIRGDPKLINFRYFFTRKLMFLSHSDAVAVFPGGFGTHDELHECLTLMQTGKSNIIPVVLVEGLGGTYWPEWQEYVDEHLLARNMISPEDRNLYYIAPNAQAAADHVENFYTNFHSYRYVRNALVIRIHKAISESKLKQLNDEFAVLVASGKIEQTGALPEETDHLDLPRIVLEHTRRKYGLVRKLIDRLNQ